MLGSAGYTLVFMSAKTIVVAAVLLRNTAGQVLHVRKQETAMFMLPGGKPEPGETMLQCALRELEEELGLRLPAGALEQFGVFVAPAANEAGFQVRATVFAVADPLLATPQPAAEIAEVRWIAPAAAGPEVAPLNTAYVFPRLLQA